MEFTFTYWPSRYATEGQKVTHLWSEWSVELSRIEPTRLNKSSLPGLVLGKMRDGERRKNIHVLTVEALALDVECPSNRPKGWWLPRVEHTLEDRIRHLEYVAYTTFSHREASPRLRLIFPLSEPISPDQYKGAMSHLNCLTGHIADLNAQKLSQPVYLPRCPVDSTEHWATHHPGEFFEPSEELIALRMALGEGHGRAPTNPAVRQACQRLLRGEAYADRGARDETALRIMWHLGRSHKDISPEALETLFHWSSREMDVDAPTVEDLLSKLERGVEKKSLLQEQPVSTSDVYLVQYRSSYYVRQKPGLEGFSRAYIKDEAKVAVVKNLSGYDEVELSYETQSGARKRKQYDTLMEQYGALADDALIDLKAHHTYFDRETSTVHEASVRWPELEPRYDPEINTWLEMLGGEKLKDWLSILSDLKRLSSALVIMGPRAIGKTLLAMGCAKRFGSDAPAKQDALTGRFQEELARCPLVYIDEDIDENPYDRNFLATIRSELSITERSVNRKYIAPVQMVGAIRCIISANHLPFKQKDAQTGQDLAAIAERFYWINVTAEAAEYLRSIGAEKLKVWRESLIARHIRHLEDTRRVSTENRFGVSGDSEKLADLINIGVKWNSWVTEWICNGVLDGFRRLDTGDKDITNGGVIYKGDAYVRVRTVVKAWDRYLPNLRVAPDLRPISDALRGIADPTQKYQPRDIGVPGNNQQRYYKIRTSPLITFLEQTAAGTLEELQTALERGNETIQ